MTRIEICGGIASGKTTLAKLVAEGGSCDLVLEQYRENPFWIRYHASPETWVEEKNFCFLLQHIGAIKAMGDAGLVVCDYAVFQDLAYARLVENRNHSQLMKALFKHLYSKYEPPTLVVFLSCSPQIQLQRIRARGRPEEVGMAVDYLAKLNSAIGSIVKEVVPKTRVHHISTDVIDFATQPHTAAAVKAEILARVASALAP